MKRKNDIYYKDELHKLSRKIHMAKATRKLAVKTTSLPNTKGRSQKVSHV